MGKKTKQSKKKSEFLEKLLLKIVPIILTSFITFIPNFLAREYKINLSFIEKSGEELVFENSESLADAWFNIQGQVVIKSKDNIMIKTFIIDDMFESKSVHIIENKIFKIKRVECLLADEWIEKLKAELDRELVSNGYAPEEITYEKIGFVCVSVKSKYGYNWLPFYHILEGDSLTPIALSTAEDKAKGVLVTKDFLENETDVNKVIQETVDKVLEELNGKR